MWTARVASNPGLLTHAATACRLRQLEALQPLPMPTAQTELMATDTH